MLSRQMKQNETKIVGWHLANVHPRSSDEPVQNSEFRIQKLLTVCDETEWYFQYSEFRVQGSYLPDMFCSSILTADENLVQDIFLIFIDL